MAPKKKKGKAQGGSEEGKDRESDTEREEQLQREYDTLTETLNNIKKRADQLRRDNKALDDEVNRIHMESQEYMSYMSKRKQKLQNLIVSLSEQKEQKLEKLSEQRKEMVQKHEERVNGLKKEILEKETELARVKLEIAELKSVKSLQQQQLARIAELENKEAAACCHQIETLHDLTTNSLREKEHHNAVSKQMVQECSLKANKEAPRCMVSYIQQVTEENCHLNEQLNQLMQRTQALHSHLQHLQMQYRQLQLDKDFVQELERLQSVRQCQHKSSFSQLTDSEWQDSKSFCD